MGKQKLHRAIARTMARLNSYIATAVHTWKTTGKFYLSITPKRTKVNSLIAGGNMSYIDVAGVDSYFGGADSKMSTMPLSEFLEYKDINIESLFLFKEGQWHVKSRPR